jgi:hypothetical protein
MTDGAPRLLGEPAPRSPKASRWRRRRNDTIFQIQNLAVLGFLELSLGDARAADRHLRPSGRFSCDVFQRRARLGDEALEPADRRALVPGGVALEVEDAEAERVFEAELPELASRLSRR